MELHNIISIILMIIGGLFMVIAGWGVVTLPDTYLRLSATSKSATLGVISILLAAVSHFYTDFGVVNRALATILFVLITAPISAHMLGRAAKIRGEKLWEQSVIDESRDHYEDMKRAAADARTLAELKDSGLAPRASTWQPDSRDSWNQ